MREISYKSPLYIQLREVIRSKIEEEEYLPGTAIPSENQLMETYGLNRVSVRSALAALEELYIPYSVVPGLEKVDIKLFSIYDIYQWNGIVLGEGHQTLRITRLPPMLAKHMDVPPEQAVMEFSCTTRDRGGRVVEFSRSYVRNDKAEFVVHFRHTNP